MGARTNARRNNEGATSMSSLPLHPAIVHLPLGLAFVMPALAAGFAWALWTGRVRARAWLVVVALQATVVGAGLLAINTGEREEDKVEAIVPGSALEEHEQRAEQFVWSAAITFAIAGLAGLMPWRTASRAMALATIVGTLIVTGAAVRVGEAGGRLVYSHNAGAAYAERAANSKQAAQPAHETGRNNDD
jgi:uncharacterized membrane protein